MPDTLVVNSDASAFQNFIRAMALALHAKDKPPADRPAWEERRARLRRAMFTAMGPFPGEACPLDPEILRTLKRPGFRIENLVFQSRPNVWVTANAYVPEAVKGKVPAVLAVHGHWPLARRDPVVQARCLGLVKLGFFVLAVDAFGAGERYTNPGPGTYHGALYGSTLWPTGHTLLGMQVYDNRRAVDYLLTRPEVDGDWLGITGASGGGNQTMYAGALDERFRAVVPVCSVGTYQAYLHAACCVCEVLPGALRFAEEGDVLALVAPRALMVVNASRDGYQFSPGEANKSLARAEAVFQLYDAGDRVRHDIFESGHAYSQPMREAMYGWMTRWLKREGDGKAIPEPKHEIEKIEDVSCYPDKVRPKGFIFPPGFAGQEGRKLLAKQAAYKPDHQEAWESQAMYLRWELQKQVFGDFPPLPKPDAVPGKPETAEHVTATPVVFHPEPGMPVPAVLQVKDSTKGTQPACVLLHLDGKAEAIKNPLASALLDQGWAILAPDLRATGTTRPPGDVIRAADHNSAEHALWIGRPLLGQWVFDVLCLLDWLALQPGLDRRRFAVAGIGQAGIVALCATGLLDDRLASAAAVAAPVTYVTDEEYGPHTRMGLLAPGILRFADVPRLAALSAPRRLIIAGGLTPQGQAVKGNDLQQAFRFTHDMFNLFKAEKDLKVMDTGDAAAIAAAL
jgi:cephalosporin-C deacetylase-like acetyl esterase